MIKKIALIIFGTTLLFTSCNSVKIFSDNIRELDIGTKNIYSLESSNKEKKKLEDIIVFNEEGVTIRREGNNLILSMPELILFDFDKYDIKNKIKPSLKTLAKALGNNRDILIKINGYTDFIGSEAYNLELSIKRANAIKYYLVKNGAINDNISIEGYGKQNPIDSNITEQGRARNRRVEFIITRYE